MLMNVSISLEMWMQCGPSHVKCGCNVIPCWPSLGQFFSLKNSKFFSGLKKIAPEWRPLLLTTVLFELSIGILLEFLVTLI